MFYELSPNAIQQIRDFVENDGPIPSQDAVNTFNALHFAFNKKMYKSLTESRSKQKTLEKRVTSLRKKEDDRAAAGVFKETVPGLDSVDVAKALIWCLNQKQTWKLSIPKVVAILYEMYASWLASKHERLFVQHPEATQYGPQFWRVTRKVTSMTATYEDWKKIAEQNPGIAEFCKNAAAKYYDWKLSDLTRPVLNSKPYLNAHADKNGGKWNKELSDADIFAWKSNIK